MDKKDLLQIKCLGGGGGGGVYYKQTSFNKMFIHLDKGIEKYFNFICQK